MEKDVQNDVHAQDEIVDERIAKGAEDDFSHDNQLLSRRS